jgi:hypothetical protein
MADDLRRKAMTVMGIRVRFHASIIGCFERFVSLDYCDNAALSERRPKREVVRNSSYTRKESWYRGFNCELLNSGREAISGRTKSPC